MHMGQYSQEEAPHSKENTFQLFRTLIFSHFLSLHFNPFWHIVALSDEGRAGQILRESPTGTATPHGVVPGLVGPGQLRVRCEKKEAEERACTDHRHEWRYGNTRSDFPSRSRVKCCFGKARVTKFAESTRACGQRKSTNVTALS